MRILILKLWRIWGGGIYGKSTSHLKMRRTNKEYKYNILDYRVQFAIIRVFGGLNASLGIFSAQIITLSDTKISDKFYVEINFPWNKIVTHEHFSFSHFCLMKSFVFLLTLYFNGSLPGGRETDDGFDDSIAAASFSSCGTLFIYFSPTENRIRENKTVL